MQNVVIDSEAFRNIMLKSISLTVMLIITCTGSEERL